METRDPFLEPGALVRHPQAGDWGLGQVQSVAGAKVTVSNDSKGIKRTVATNEAGIFTAPALPPAQGYAVTVDMAGFAPLLAARFAARTLADPALSAEQRQTTIRSLVPIDLERP